MSGSPEHIPRRTPRTDVLLADPRLVEATVRLGYSIVKDAVRTAQAAVRRGELAPEDAVDAALSALPEVASSLRPVVNATGVLLHTNLGRAPLSAAATAALAAAAGTTDIEFDLVTGRRRRRGHAALNALAAQVPEAEAVHVVNNGVGALALAATALAAGREIVVSRGEMIEIGDGFRLPDLLTSTGAILREVGTTNRTTVRDYAEVIGPRTGFLLKVHPSNFVISGFTAAASVAELARLDVPLVVDIGSGLLRRHRRLPGEPDAATVLKAGADLVIASGDKLLGGPQCGLVLGRVGIVEQLRRHPLARALRVDKLTFAALEATLRGPATPTVQALERTVDELSGRAHAIVGKLRDHGVDAVAVGSTASVGGGGAPGVSIPSAAVSLPDRYAAALRGGPRPVVGRVSGGRCLLDLIAVAPADDAVLVEAVLAVPR